MSHVWNVIIFYLNKSTQMNDKKGRKEIMSYSSFLHLISSVEFGTIRSSNSLNNADTEVKITPRF